MKDILVDVVPNDSQKRIAMTDEQQKIWMDYIRNDKTYCKYYDEFVVLLEIYRSLKNILACRKSLKVEMIVDGYSNFLLLTKDDTDMQGKRKKSG